MKKLLILLVALIFVGCSQKVQLQHTQKVLTQEEMVNGETEVHGFKADKVKFIKNGELNYILAQLIDNKYVQLGTMSIESPEFYEKALQQIPKEKSFTEKGILYYPIVKTVVNKDEEATVIDMMSTTISLVKLEKYTLVFNNIPEEAILQITKGAL